MLVEGKDRKTVVRLIEDEEMELFQGLKLVHGKIKDKHYMHLKTVDSDKNVNWNTGYIDNNKKELNEFEEASQDASPENEVQKDQRPGTAKEIGCHYNKSR